MASVRERPRAGRQSTWAVLYRHGRKQASKTFEAEAPALRFKRLVEDLGPDRALAVLNEETRPIGLTLDELAAQWLASKPGNVTPNILRGYKRDYDNWVSPYLGHREADAVSEIDVQAWVDRLRTTVSPTTKRPLSAKSIADRHAILHQIYRWGSARTRALVHHNPCKETELPKRTKTTVKGLRLPELHALLEAGERVGDRDTADVIAFLAGTGFRISEAVALPAGAVEEVDVLGEDGQQMTAVYVTMHQVLRRGVGITQGGKSDASVGRRLRVIGPGADVLRRRIVGLGPTDLVFTFADGRPGVKRRGPWNVNSFRDLRWPKIVEAAGLKERKPTPHWLRHTHVALCHAAGMSLAEIQRRLGHEDIQMTINTYGRTIEDMDATAAARADALFVPRDLALVRGEVVTPPVLD